MVAKDYKARLLKIQMFWILNLTVNLFVLMEVHYGDNLFGPGNQILIDFCKMLCGANHRL